MNNKRIPVEEFLQNNQTFQQGSEEAAILFADLVGSTEFKRDHTALQGLAKTVLHNDTIRAAITQHQGNVVKILGDGVMGIFQGSDACANALQAGLAAITGIDAANKKQSWLFPYAMSTRIGVHFGNIWMFDHPEATVSDPQGSTVDIAARLASIAGPQQLVCTNDDFQKAGHIDCCASEPQTRFVKGISTPLVLRSLVPAGWKCDPQQLLGLPSPLPEEVARGLELMREQKLSDALNTFKAYLRKDPANFHANLYAGFLLLQEARDQAGIDETQKYLCAAKWARPHASRVWLLLSWLRFKEYQFNNEPKSLDVAIRYVDTAVLCAADGFNHEATIESKTYLARYLFTRAKLNAETRKADLDRAGNTCAQLARTIEGSVPQHRLEYYVTYALVLLASGDVATATKLIEKAESIDRGFLGVQEAKLELAKRTGTPSQGPRVLD